jgi:phenylacetate-CoA ligase
VDTARLIDWLSGKRSVEHFRESLRWADYSPEERAARRVLKLGRLLNHCGRHVPFYRDAFRFADINPERISSLDALRKLPIVDKSLILSKYWRFVPENLSAFRNIRSGCTGGTTGQILRYYKDVNVRSAALGALMGFYHTMGVRIDDPHVLVWSKPVVPAGLRKRLRDAVLARLTNGRVIDAFSIADSAFDTYRAIFEEHHPVFVRGYAQALRELAAIFVRHGYRYSLKAVTTTAEPLRTDDRECFREVFGCETFDQYACGEVESVAFEGEEHRGLLVAGQRCVFEVGRSGEVILTDLDNFAFPFVRYRNGDVVEVGPGDVEDGWDVRRIRRVQGRTADVVVGPNGVRSHPDFFTHLLTETGVAARYDISAYQVVQGRDLSIEWKLVMDVPLRPEDDELLRRRTQEHFGPLPVTMVVAGQIARSASGKFRYVISHASGGDTEFTGTPRTASGPGGCS